MLIADYSDQKFSPNNQSVSFAEGFAITAIFVLPILFLVVITSI